jgi:hypothetical protein
MCQPSRGEDDADEVIFWDYNLHNISNYHNSSMVREVILNLLAAVRFSHDP